MTLVDTSLRVPVSWGAGARRSRSAPWRMASRLARREVRRRPGRTLLVVVLVALPVLAMTAGAVIARTTRPTADQSFTATAGPVADLALQRNPGDLPDERLAELLPEGSRWARYQVATGNALTDGPTPRTAYTDVLDLDLGDPVAGGVLDLVSGRAPGDGEVAVTADVASALDVERGDTLTLARPAGSWEVVGIVRWPGDHRRSGILAPSFDWGRVVPGDIREELLVDVPGRPGPAESDALLVLLQGGTARSSAGDDLGDVPAEGLAWGWVAGVLGLVAVGIVITAAFATSARRQLVTVGQLSAQGAPPHLVRWTLALQGSWNGLFGSILGVVVAIAGLWLGFPLLETVAGRDLDGLVVRPLDVLVVMATGIAAATIAALLPARTAARIPTLTALSGRRPVGAVPRRLVPIGLALFGGGLFLLALAAGGSVGEVTPGNSNLLAAAAVLGGLGVMFGACCASPLAVTVAAGLGARLPASWRLAARSMGRLRTRSAGVVTAIAVTGAIALALSTVTVTEVGSRDQLEGAAAFHGLPALPADAVLLSAQAWRDDGSPVAPAEVVVSPTVSAAVRDLFPDAEVHPVRRAVAATAPDEVDPPPIPTDAVLVGELVVADPGVLDAIGLSDRDEAALRSTGALVVDTSLFSLAVPVDDPSPAETAVPEGPVDVAVDGAPEIEAAVRRDLPATRGGDTTPVLVTEERARRAGLQVVEAGELVRIGRPIGELDQGALEDLSAGSNATSSFLAAGEAVEDPASSPVRLDTFVSWDWIDTDPDLGPAEVQALIVLVALALTLVVVAVGLGLSAVESRDDRDVLIAVGAKPVTLRRMAGVRAVLLTATGTVLAVPVGLLPAVVVLQAASDAPLRLPWLAVGTLVLVVPAMAGVAAWATSAVIQRVRPPHASSLAVD